MPLAPTIQATIERGNKKEDVLTAVSNLIEAAHTKEKELKEQIHSMAAALEDKFYAFPEYKEAKELSEQSAAKKKKVRGLAIQDPLVYKLSDDLKKLRDEKKGLQLRLSNYLLEYEASTQLSLFEFKDGTVYEIRKNAWAVKSQSKKPVFKKKRKQ